MLQLLSSLAQAASFESLSHGLIADVSAGSAPVGDLLLGELGGATLGLITTHDDRLLHQWDCLLAVKGGELAATHPFTTLLGGHGRAMLESGYRFEPQRAWSLYAGLRLAGDVQVLLPPGTGLGQLANVNNISGVGDVNVAGLVRLAVGASYLNDTTALLLTAFVQGSGRIAETNDAGGAFQDVGVALRFDRPRAIALSLEAVWGETAARSKPALGLSEVTTHSAVTFDGRHIFGNGMWLGGAVSYASEADVLRYPATTYRTDAAPTVVVTLLYGFPLGKQAGR